jgi:simple sugar transport system substrate-binding protein
MINWKFVPLFACAVSLLFPVTNFAQGRPRIIIVTHGQAADSFWRIVRNGAETAAAETECDLDYRSPEKFDLAAMAQLVDSAVAAKPDGLIVSIPDTGENPGHFNQFRIRSLKAAWMLNAHRPGG